MDINNGIMKILRLKGVYAASVDKQRRVVILYVDPSFSREDYEKVVKFVYTNYGQDYKIDVITTPPLVML